MTTVTSKPFAVTDETFAQAVERAQGLILVDFWAAWCAPCRMIAPVLEQIAAEYPDQIKIAKLDVDSNPATAMKYGVMSIPTLILFKDGQPVDRLVGYMPKERLLMRLRPHFSTPKA
ncbi:MAG: thioredoxin [Thermoflexales bacterium]|nr:thioredoxin [Thermoflexales bacterium]MCS7323882.1 thioredoxin [Thermoflexales bacterium]MCX7938454.1 thioredoxin [Thermoflexales bacterium]MDW8053789.1 thioredoxin [Anaerolineae bacterium]MDW8293297.1 thioredoxin [Anaerolineae bacterium]